MFQRKENKVPFVQGNIFKNFYSNFKSKQKIQQTLNTNYQLKFGNTNNFSSNFMNNIKDAIKNVSSNNNDAEDEIPLSNIHTQSSKETGNIFSKTAKSNSNLISHNIVFGEGNKRISNQTSASNDKYRSVIKKKTVSGFASFANSIIKKTEEMHQQRKSKEEDNKNFHERVFSNQQTSNYKHFSGMKDNSQAHEKNKRIKEDINEYDDNTDSFVGNNKGDKMSANSRNLFNFQSNDKLVHISREDPFKSKESNIDNFVVNNSKFIEIDDVENDLNKINDNEYLLKKAETKSDGKKKFGFINKLKKAKEAETKNLDNSVNKESEAQSDNCFEDAIDYVKILKMPVEFTPNDSIINSYNNDNERGSYNFNNNAVTTNSNYKPTNNTAQDSNTNNCEDEFEEEINHKQIVNSFIKEKIGEKVLIDEDYLKKNSKIIRNLSIGKSRTILNKLYEVQSIDLKEKQIYCIKASNDGNYIAIGGASGKLKILQICGLENFLLKIYEEYIQKEVDEKSTEFIKNDILKVFEEGIFRELGVHDKEIIDINWSVFNSSFILTASCDNYACLIDILEEDVIRKYKHKSIVTSVCFLESTMDEFFATSCLDKIIRIWNINQSEYLNYINVQDYITVLTPFPLGEQIIIGTQRGKCLTYDLSYDNKTNNINISFHQSFELPTENHKITGIEFLTSDTALITSNDSKIRLVNVVSGEIKIEFHGCLNEISLLKASYDDRSSSIVCCSDDGNAYVWPIELNANFIQTLKIAGLSSSTLNLINQVNYTSLQKADTKKTIKEESKSIIIKQNEYFQCLKNLEDVENIDNVSSDEEKNEIRDKFTCSAFLKDNAFYQYFSKLNFLSTGFNVSQIFLNCRTDGLLQVIFNIRLRQDNRRIITASSLYGD